MDPTPGISPITGTSINGVTQLGVGYYMMKFVAKGNGIICVTQGVTRLDYCDVILEYPGGAYVADKN